MSKPILVGYDPRGTDHAPVDFGVAAAEFTGAPLIVTAVESGHGIHPAAEVDDELVADCAGVLAAVESELGAGDIVAECRRVKSTSAARALHETAEAEDAGLLVVGSSRRSGVGRVLSGSTAMRLLHGAPCPVTVVPRGWAAGGGLSTIGVAYVDNEEGREALRGAHALARKAGAKLRMIAAVKVTGEMYLDTDQFRKDVLNTEGEHRAAAEEHLREVASELGGDVPVEADAFMGDPADSLVAVSQHLDLLVCGSRGYGPARAVLLGSVTRRVTEESHCPVIVLPRGVKASLEAVVSEAPGAGAAA